MPKLLNNANMSVVKMASNYDFSTVNFDDLGASEYTLVTIVLDISSSLNGWEKELERCLKAAVASCQKSPRSENLLVRLITFNHGVSEVHGFLLLNEVNVDDYDNTLNCSGSTALFDATYQGIEAVKVMGKNMLDQDYLTNAIVFVITDGEDNNSKFTPNNVKQLVADIRKSEQLESIKTILIGMSSYPTVQAALDRFNKEAEFDQYLDMGDVSEGKLAKLADFVSRSVSSTSVALGTGGPSQNLVI